MNINSEKWLKTLIIKNINNNDAEKYNSNSDEWIRTLPRENRKNFIKNYSMLGVLFVIGLMFVSVIKNETRNLQKNINIVQKSISNLKVELHQETLDHEIITSPENLMLLAREHLDDNLIPYKRPQIQKLKSENKNFTSNLKENIVRKIKKKKLEIVKLKKVYSNPKEIPAEIKLALGKKIEAKKKDIYQLYTNPKESISISKTTRWALFQVVKLFAGIPIVPGK
jgi:hypothetical protein